MRMSNLTNKFKVIRYFIKNGIFNEERAIEISKFDHNTIDDNVKIKFTKMDRLIFTNLDRII